MAIWTDQVPLAHRWKEVPATQFQAPSSVQAVPGVMAPEEPELEVPVPAGVEAAVVADGLAEGTTAAEVAAAAGVVAAAAVGVVRVMKTPPGRLEDGEFPVPEPVPWEGRVVLSAG
jgi:glucose/arabinose dehydrogenase